ncbi:hypothetical protein D3C74_502040 [compost metagenome]
MALEISSRALEVTLGATRNSVLRDFNNSHAGGGHERLYAVADIKLDEDLGHVGLHRGFCDPQSFRDFSVI